ncbi:MAG TPA: tetratricopeptide repeat protein, partial [Anaerolineae bacterium]
QAAAQNLIQAYANARNWDAARSAAEAWLARMPDSPQAQWILAELIAVDDPAGAQDHLAYAPGEAARLYIPVLNEPDRALRSELLGRVYLSQANLALAARAFADAMTANPAYAEAYAYYGFTLDQLGEDGEPSLDQALALDPNLIAARYFRARHAWTRGDLDSAQADLQAALDREPLNRLIAAELGRVYLQRSEYASAEKWLTTARDLDPADPVGWKTLAELYVGRAYGSPAQAVSTAQQAVNLTPNDAAAHLWLGRAYLISGDRDRAEDELRRSIELDPRSAVAHLYLGRLLTKNFEEGRLEFERAIGLDPDGPIGAQASRTLEMP